MKLPTIVAFLLFAVSNAVDQTSLIRRAEKNHNEIKHGIAYEGDTCVNHCDCEGWEEGSLCCEKRYFGEKRCYKCCKHFEEECTVNSDCCSQNCVGGVCKPCGSRCNPSPVGWCDILFSTDKLSVDPPLVPPGKKPPTYVMPSRTGPLRQIWFCPKHPDGDGDPVYYRLRGACAGDTTWTDIQEGDLTIHLDVDGAIVNNNHDGNCYLIPVAYNPQLHPNHPPEVDYLKYHLTFWMDNAQTEVYTRKIQVGPQSDKGGKQWETRFLAKCSQAIDWGKPVTQTAGLHP